ncbi:MAG: hypothetical protein C0597_04750, partial [Marinilabiliales bacterium]
KKTVIITGAGSCVPYGMPTGKMLKRSILGSLMDGGFIELKNLSSKVWQSDSYLEHIEYPNEEIVRFILNRYDYKLMDDFARRFSESGQTSIDAFLKHNLNYLEIGKLSIILNILLFEKYAKHQIIDSRKDHWLEYIWNQINDSEQSILDSNLAFVTFNYDRVIEHYFESVIRNSFQLDKKDEKDLFNSIPIVHVYGKIANLPSVQNKPPNIRFGEFDERIFNELTSDSLDIVYDNTEENQNLKDTHVLISNADRILILGFGYHELNMQRLVLEKSKAARNGSIYGSCMGFNSNEQKKLTNKYPFLKLFELNNLEFLREVMILDDVKRQVRIY